MRQNPNDNTKCIDLFLGMLTIFVLTIVNLEKNCGFRLFLYFNNILQISLSIPNLFKDKFS